MQGRLTRNPEITITNNGKSVCRFSIAVSEWRNKQSTVMFVDCRAWGWLAEHVNQYFHKGQECVVDGKLRIDTWEKDGEKRKSTYIDANDVSFCGGKPQEHRFQPDETPEPEEVFEPVDGTEDDMPF